jgi:hypothetical protein
MKSSVRRSEPWALASLMVLLVSGCSSAGDLHEDSGRTGGISSVTVGATAGGGSGTGSGVTVTSSPTGNPYAGASLGFSPNHGESLYDNPTFTSPWYDPATQSIHVQGVATGIPGWLIGSGNLVVIVNGQFPGVITSTSAASGMLAFESQIPATVDHGWLQRTILVELVYTVDNHVVARRQNTYFDFRQEEHTSVDAQIDDIVGIGAQLTDTGIGKGLTSDMVESLEVPHLSTLPHPSLEVFNEALGAEANGLPSDTSVAAGTCIPLDDVDARFMLEASYIMAYGVALSLYGVYEAYQNGGEEACMSAASSLGAIVPIFGFLGAAACASAMTNWCVKSIPERSDFELCVDRLEGDPTDLSIAAVSDVQLSWGNGALLHSQIAVAGVEGKVNGLLRGLQIRWADRSCTAPASANVPDTALQRGDWLEEFATCRDLTVESPEAATDPATGAQFLVTANPGNEETVQVTQVVDPEFAFLTPNIDARRGTCAEDFLLPYAEDLAIAYQARFEDVLSDVWSSGGAHTQQAEALELLLSRLNLGAPSRASYDETIAFSSILSEPAGGAVFEWTTKVQALDPRTLARMKIGQLYREAHPSPYFDEGVNDAGRAFDVSYTITTGYLNQILHVYGGSDLLHFQYEPTWDDVAAWGATPSNTKHPADQPPPLDGAVLSHLHSAFAELGSNQVEIHVRPTLDPMAWMNPDPPPLFEDPRTGAWLAYGLGALEVVFAEPATIDPVTKKPVPGAEWLRVKFSIWEPDFRFTFETGRNVLGTSDELRNYAVVSELTRFTGCPKVPHGVFEPPGSCERALEAAVSGMLYDLMKPRLLSMLSEIPSPNIWDAGGEATIRPELDDINRYQMNQNITFYGDIPNFD